MRQRLGEFFGSELRRMRFGGVLLTEHAYAPGVELAKHQHARPYFMLVVAGGLTERTSERQFECGPSSLLFHRPGATHSNSFGSKASRCVGVELDLGMVHALEWEPGRAAGASWAPQSAVATSLAHRLRAELRRPDSVSSVAVEGLALTLLAETARDAHADRVVRAGIPLWLASANALIHDEWRRPPTLVEIAAAVGVHPVSLARGYRRAYGRTVGEQIRELRLQHAASMLRRGDETVSAVGFTCGFADHSHLSRAFRRRFGTTPNNYRRLHRTCSGDKG